MVGGRKGELVWDLYIVQSPSRSIAKTQQTNKQHQKQQNTQKPQPNKKHTVKKRRAQICGQVLAQVGFHLMYIYYLYIYIIYINNIYKYKTNNIGYDRTPKTLLQIRSFPNSFLQTVSSPFSTAVKSLYWLSKHLNTTSDGHMFPHQIGNDLGVVTQAVSLKIPFSMG